MFQQICYVRGILRLKETYERGPRKHGRSYPVPAAIFFSSDGLAWTCGALIAE